MYKKNLAYDCSEIADDLMESANGKGKIYHIEPKKAGQLKVKEYGNTKKYFYHDVYSDGKFIYDPRYSATPISNKTYFDPNYSS